MAAQSTHMKIMEAIQTRIQALITAGTLSGIDTDDVVIMEVPSDEDKDIDELPSILIAPFGTEEYGEGTNAEDQIIYPSLVAILASKIDVQDNDELDLRLLWRELLLDDFIHNRPRFPDVNIMDSRIDLNPIVDPGAWYESALFVSSFSILAETLKQRRAPP